MTPRGVLINGKFIGQPLTAVHRVALELTRALIRTGALGQVRIAVPPRQSDDLPKDVPLLPVGALGGIAWEQISLPRGLDDRLLLNLCNMTPLFVRNAMTLVHDAQVFTTPRSYGRLRGAWARRHIRAAARVQRGLLTVSGFAKAELVALGIAPADRVHVVSNGVDHVLRTPADDAILQRLGLVPRGFSLSLANTQPHKNIGVLLRAFARPELAGMTLVLTGQATAATFRAMGQSVPPNVIFAGYVSDGEMRSLQAQALAVCTPSLTEGFGLPPVEGMLLGTPAVVAPCGALPEVCGAGALHADPHDPAAWAAALARLHIDPALWRRLSAAGQEIARRFTWDAAAEKLAGIVAAEAPRPPKRK